MHSTGLGLRLWRAYAPLAVLWLGYYVGVSLVIGPLGGEVRLITEAFVQMYVTIVCLTILALLIRFFLRYCALGQMRPADRFATLTRDTSWPEILGLGWIPPLLMVFTIMGMFKSFKPFIPELNPFTWDPVFIAWDRVLFLGHDGWEVTHWLLPGALATKIIDSFYLSWFLLVLATIMVAGFSRMTCKRRLAFLMTFNLNWIVAGSICAVIFSSVGPVFMDRLNGDETFLPMLAQLEAAHAQYDLATVRGIDLLWSAHIGMPGVAEYGISAFPSLHVCISMMLALYVGGWGRLWAIASWSFVAIILFGSVHLGWHYLVDGLAGMALCWLNWWASLRFAGWWLRD